jgi:hypothetical protein
MDVPGRAQIKIHIANKASQLKGCIAPGKALGAELGTWAVQRSREAYAEWMAAAAEQKVERLIVQWNPVEPA